MPHLPNLRHIFHSRGTTSSPSTSTSNTLALPSALPSITATAFSTSYLHLKDIKPGCHGPIALYTHSASHQSIIVKPARSVHPQRPLEYDILNLCRNSPNIVTVLGFCAARPDPTTDVILLEYCAFGDLLDYQNELCENKIYASEKTLRNVFKQLLLALAFLHYGIGPGVDLRTWEAIVHRDIKLENVLISRLDDGTGRRDIVGIKLTDFDLATKYDEKHCVLKHGTGTPITWPPEQTLQDCQATPVGDVWAAAGVVHALAHSSYPKQDVFEYKTEYLLEHDGRYPREIDVQDVGTLRERWYWDALTPCKTKRLTEVADGYDAAGLRVNRRQSGWQGNVTEWRQVYTDEFGELVGSALSGLRGRKTALQLLGELSNMLNY